MTFVTKSYDLLMTTYVGRFELNNANIPKTVPTQRRQETCIKICT